MKKRDERDEKIFEKRLQGKRTFAKLKFKFYFEF